MAATSLAAPAPMRSMGSGDLRKHQSCKRNAIKSTKKLKTSANYIIPCIMHEAVVCVGCGNEIPKATDRRNISIKQTKEVSSLLRDF